MTSTQGTVSPETPATAKRRTRKRADGEGSIYQRSDGLWVGELMAGYRPDGKPDRRRVSAKTQSECRRKLDALKRQHAGGLLTDRAKRDTLAGFLDRWLEGIAASIRPTTHNRYREVLRLHVIPHLGTKRLETLRPDDVQRLYALLHTALEQAVKWGYVPRNVCDIVDPPRVARREMRPPEAAEVATLLDAEHDPRFLTLWTLAVYTGARQGELLGLQWPDVDLERGALTIQRTLLQTTRGGVPAYAPPKTAKSRRTIALPEEAIDALRTHRQRQIEGRLLLGPDYTDLGLVFASATGTPLGYRNVMRAFKAALGRAGLPLTIRFHDLRHGAATILRSGNIDLKTVSERLGHSNIGITGDLYTHSVPQADRDAATMLQKLIRGARPRSETAEER